MLALSSARLKQALESNTSYYSGFGDPVDFLFANFGIGWHYETGVQLLRLIFSGVLDRHPRLQLVIGHGGEVVLFFLERTAMMQRAGLHLDRPLADYFRQNVWATGSGVLSERYLRWTAEVVGTDRILYATDYPFIGTGAGQALAFLEHAPLTDEEKSAIGSGNWERLAGQLSTLSGNRWLTRSASGPPACYIASPGALALARYSRPGSFG